MDCENCLSKRKRIYAPKITLTSIWNDSRNMKCIQELRSSFHLTTLWNIFVLIPIPYML